MVDVKRISKSTSLPLLVDIDTGWGDGTNISNSIEKMIEAGAAAVHLEDQIEAKRCGHRPNKKLISSKEMCERIKSAVEGRTDPNFFIIAIIKKFGSVLPSTALLILSHISFDEINFLFGLCPHLFASI